MNRLLYFYKDKLQMADNRFEPILHIPKRWNKGMQCIWRCKEANMLSIRSAFY